MRKQYKSAVRSPATTRTEAANSNQKASLYVTCPMSMSHPLKKELMQLGYSDVEIGTRGIRVSMPPAELYRAIYKYAKKLIKNSVVIFSG
jgi:hypothetical protein